jgi:hypothetical protein
MLKIPFDLLFRPTIGDGSLVRLLYCLARPDEIESTGSLSIFLPTLAGISSASPIYLENKLVPLEFCWFFPAFLAVLLEQQHFFILNVLTCLKQQ